MGDDRHIDFHRTHGWSGPMDARRYPPRDTPCAARTRLRRQLAADGRTQRRKLLLVALEVFHGKRLPLLEDGRDIFTSGGRAPKWPPGRKPGSTGEIVWNRPSGCS